MYVLPVKREREAKVVRSEISLLEAQENQARKELIRDIKLAYIDWYYTMKSIELYAKAKEELLALEKLTEANYKLGRANLSDLLSLKAELIRFDREIKDREAKVRLLKEELDYLVGDSFKLKGEEPKVEKIDIKALSEEAFPSLRVLEKEREKLKKEVERRQVEYLPDFELMAEYMIRPELDNMFSLRLSFGLPIRKSKREDLMVLEKLEEVKAKEREFENLRLLVRKEINSLRVEEERLKTLKELTERLIREKEAELKALELAYRYTKADFRDLLRLYRELWELRTNLLELEGELKKVYIRAEVFL
jgi:outer membrane protein TolC